MGSLPGRISIHKKRRPVYGASVTNIMYRNNGFRNWKNRGKWKTYYYWSNKTTAFRPIYRNGTYKLLFGTANDCFRNYRFCAKFEYKHLLHDIRRPAPTTSDTHVMSVRVVSLKLSIVALDGCSSRYL